MIVMWKKENLIHNKEYGGANNPQLHLYLLNLIIKVLHLYPQQHFMIIYSTYTSGSDSGSCSTSVGLLI